MGARKSSPGISYSHSRSCADPARCDKTCNPGEGWIAFVFDAKYVDPVTGKRGKKIRQRFAHRDRSDIRRCEAFGSTGLQCKSHLAAGETRCGHHGWLGAQGFAAELADGAEVPASLSRWQLQGLGIRVAEVIQETPTKGKELKALLLSDRGA